MAGRDVVLTFRFDTAGADKEIRKLATATRGLNTSLKALHSWTGKLGTVSGTTTTKVGAMAGALDKVNTSAASALANITAIANALRTVSTAAPGATSGITAYKSALTTGGRTISAFAARNRTLAANVRSARTALAAAGTAVAKTGSRFATATPSVTKFRTAIRTVGTASTKAASTLATDMPNAIKGLSAEIRNLNKVIATMQKSLGKVGGTNFAQAVKLLKDLNRQRLTRVTGEVDRLSRSSRGLGNSLRVVSGVFVSMGNNIVGSISRATLALTRLFSGLRQVGQAFLNLGITANIFIGLPLQRALESILGSVLDFDDAIGKVRKTVDLTGKEINDTLVPALRSMALIIPVSTAELAELAAVAGQLGITAPSDILKLVEVGAKLGIASDLTAEQSVEALGRIAEAYGVADSKIGPYAQHLADVITRLGNDTAATESDIVEAMSNTIATAKLLNIPAHQVAALVAGLRESGLSAEESGTALRRAFENMVDNEDIIAEAMAMPIAQVRDFIREDPIGFFIDLVNSINKMPDSEERFRAALDIFEVRGLRALSSTTENLQENLALANYEWEHGGALATEFNKALQTTRNQLQLTKNSFSEIALVLGDAFLPVLNKVLRFAAAGGQLLAAALKKLPDQTKIFIVLIIAAIPVLLAMFTVLGSVIFAINIFVSGILTAAAALGAFLSMVAPFVAAVAGIGVAMVAAAAVANEKFSEMINNIVPMLDSVIADVDQWGSKLMRSLAMGILNGAKYVVQAVVAVANVIASFFRAKSPPEQGPLSQIVQWGRNLIDTYLSAFKTADFDILKDVAGIVRDIFEAFSVEGIMGEVDIIPNLLAFREGLSELISIFNRTGEIAEDVLARITAPLGEAADEIAKLVRLSLAYNAALEELERIKSRREDIDKATKREIRAIALRRDLTAAEKLVLIRQAQARKRVLNESLDLEEQAAEDRKDAAAEELERHKALVDALRDEMDLRREQLELLKRLAEAVEKADKEPKEPKADEGLGYAFDFQPAIDGVHDFEYEFDGSIQNIIGLIDEAKQAWQAFWTGLTTDRESIGTTVMVPGDELHPGIPRPDAGVITRDVSNAFEFGRMIRRNFLAIIEVINQANEELDTLSDEMGRFFSGEKSGISVNPDLTKRLQEIASLVLALSVVRFGPGILNVLKAIGGLGLPTKASVLLVLAGVIQSLLDNQDSIKTIVGKLMGDDAKAAGTTIWETVAGFALTLYETLVDIGKLIGVTTLSALLNLVGEPGQWERVAGAAANLEDSLGRIFGGEGNLATSFAFGAGLIKPPDDMLLPTRQPAGLNQGAVQAGQTFAAVLSEIKRLAGEAKDKIIELGDEIELLFNGEWLSEDTPMLNAIVRITSALAALGTLLSVGGVITAIGKLGLTWGKLWIALKGVAALLPTFTTLAKFGIWAILAGAIESIVKHLPQIIDWMDYMLGKTGDAPKEGATGFVSFLAGIAAEILAIFDVLSSLGFVGTETLFEGAGSEAQKNALDRLYDSVKKFVDLQEKVPAEGIIFALLFGKTALKIGKDLATGGAPGAGKAALTLAPLVRTIAKFALPAAGVGVLLLVMDEVLFGGEYRDKLGEWLQGRQDETQKTMDDLEKSTVEGAENFGKDVPPPDPFEFIKIIASPFVAIKEFLDNIGDEIERAASENFAFLAGLFGRGMPNMPTVAPPEVAGELLPDLSDPRLMAFNHGNTLRDALMGAAGEMGVKDWLFQIVFGVSGDDFQAEFDRFLGFISDITEPIRHALQQSIANIRSFLRGLSGQAFMTPAEIEEMQSAGLDVDKALTSFEAGMTLTGDDEGQSFIGFMIRTLFGLDDGSGEREAEAAGETLGQSFIDKLKEIIMGDGAIADIFEAIAKLFDAAFGPQEGGSIFDQMYRRGVGIVMSIVEGMGAMAELAFSVGAYLGAKIAEGITRKIKEAVDAIAALPIIGGLFRGVQSALDDLIKTFQSLAEGHLKNLMEGSVNTEGGGSGTNALSSAIPTGLPMGVPIPSALNEGLTNVGGDMLTFNFPGLVVDTPDRAKELAREVNRLVGQKASTRRRLGGPLAS